ncbi:AAA family ATPase [Chloroflexota bacterium]
MSKVTVKRDIDNLPNELRALRQWVVWKKDKHPRNALTGANARTNDPSTWCSFEDAYDAVMQGRALGVGFVFTEADPYVGIDFDKVIKDDGSVDSETEEAVSRMNSYTEISQSGRGIHVIVRGKKPKGSCRRKGVEIYDCGRFFALTGNIYQGRGTIEDRQEELDDLFNESFGSESVPSAPIATEIFEGEGRNNACTKEAGRLLNIYKDHEVARLMTLAYNQAVCRPPLSDDECSKTWEKSLSNWATATPEELRRLDEIETREVEWVWKPYLPLGKLTMFEGDPGEGKSWVSLAIATRITLEELGGPANVLLASAEDDFDDTIRPRLEELGANLGLIYAIEQPFTLGSKTGLNDEAFEMLERHLIEKEPSLLIIDPLTAYLGSGVDMHRQNETRPVMAKLASLARDYRCAILLIRHINKGGSTKAIYRGMGSIDFTASARSVLLAGHVDHDDGSIERAVVHIKSNLAPLGEPLGYILGRPFCWTTSTLTASEILGEKGGGGTKTDEAISLIKDHLTGVESVPSNIILAAAKDAHISERTLKAAKKKLNAKSGKKNDEWHWYFKKGGEAPPDIEPPIKIEGTRISGDFDQI